MKLGKYTLIDIATCRGLSRIIFLLMTSHFTLQSKIDFESIEEGFIFNNLLGFKSFKHNDTGLNVNFANVSGPLYTMAVVVPVTFSNLVNLLIN